MKRKLWQGLTQEAKVKLEFLEDYPLNKFIDRVEHERQRLEAKHASSHYRVRNERTMPTSASQTQPENRPILTMSFKKKKKATSSESADVEHLKRQIRDLTEQVGQLQTPNRQPRPEKYCSYCRSHTHALRECWRKPIRGTCFDCKRYGCWRGNKNCPGQPVNRT